MSIYICTHNCIPYIYCILLWELANWVYMNVAQKKNWSMCIYECGWYMLCGIFSVATATVCPTIKSASFEQVLPPEASDGPVNCSKPTDKLDLPKCVPHLPWASSSRQAASNVSPRPSSTRYLRETATTKPHDPLLRFFPRLFVSRHRPPR